MSAPLLRLGALALSGLLALAAQADAQRVLYPPSSALRPQLFQFPVNPNRYILPNTTASQVAYNIGVLGRAYRQVPPWLYGYNPYPSPILNYGPIVPTVSPYNPYALSTAPMANPYLGGSAALATDPYGAGGYSMSTIPYGSYGAPYSNPYGYGSPYGDTLQGYASLTAATGQYWKDIEKARMDRELSRQMALETARKRIQMEAWYESMKPTANQLRDRTLASDLERARREAPATEVWSGKSINDLLRSIQASGRLNRGPNIPLEEETLKHIHLTDRSSSGNVGLLKTDLKAVWPDSLKDPGYEEFRKRLTKNLPRAVDMLKDNVPVEASLLNDIRKDYRDLVNRLNDGADDLSPSQYIEARRFVNQLGAAVKALSDPKATNYFNNTWNAKGKTVAELVAHMTKEGLTFAPATVGDEGAYTALYQALRAFEAGLQSAQR